MGSVLAASRLFARRIAEVELIDRVYVLAAGSFVSLLPVLLLLTGAFEGPSAGGSIVATEIIERLGLDETAADAVRALLPRGRLSWYVAGIAITLFGAFSLSRRAARAYAAIWMLPQLPRGQQWRGLIWIIVQLASILSVAGLRDQARVSHGIGKWLLFAVALLVWFAAELFAQRLITTGQIGWKPLCLAAALVALARLLVALWAALYLATSLSRQAELYGPVGVVFSLFTSLLATIGATLGATLIASVLTRPAPSTGPAPERTP